MAAEDIDLDAIRAARLESSGSERPHIRFKGERFPLAEELPWDIVEGLTLDDGAQLVSGVKQLLGENWEKFRALGPSQADVIALSVEASKRFGLVGLGESGASEGTSSRTSRRSRQTSNGSTRSTSGKRSGGKTAPPSDGSGPT